MYMVQNPPEYDDLISEQPLVGKVLYHSALSQQRVRGTEWQGVRGTKRQGVRESVKVSESQRVRELEESQKRLRKVSEESHLKEAPMSKL